MRKLAVIFSVLVASCLNGDLMAEDHVVGQLDKTFSVQHLSIKVGDTVKFTNNDPFFHNVFSLSPAATFDLGSYAQGKFESIEFSEPGIVEVECAIHPSMTMTLEVHE